MIWLFGQGTNGLNSVTDFEQVVQALPGGIQGKVHRAALTAHTKIKGIILNPGTHQLARFIQ